nr:M20/M25/M40 family metallo-hydrolase [Sphingomonas sp. Y57]
MINFDELFSLIGALVMCHSPSGHEGEVDDLLMRKFGELGLAPRIDAAGNLIVKIAGSGPGSLAITAHKDEIGCSVHDVEADGKVRVRRLGGAFPWIYGEGVVDLLGDKGVVSGVLSFGSRHVSHASPQFAYKESAPVKWEEVWVETKLSREALRAAGIGPGARMVVGRHRKAPFRMGEHIASYTLDNKASLAILLLLASRLKNPPLDVYLVATANEEVGGLGALYFTKSQPLDALIALEIVPVAPEYSVEEGPVPAIVTEDAFAPYDRGLNQTLHRCASAVDSQAQLASLQGFGSDASFSLRAGHVAKAACFGFPTLNTHGYEIAHLGAIARCVDVLEAFCTTGAHTLAQPR